MDATLTDSPTRSPLGALELLVVWQDNVRSFPLPQRGELTIGRAESNEIRIDNPSVSRCHAVLTLGQQPSIRDLGGTNGVVLHAQQAPEAAADTVGMRRLVAASAEVAIGETIMLGGVMLVLRRAQSDPELAAFGADEPILADARLKQVYEHAELAARSNISVLILGESGAGKEVLARRIHAASPRVAAPFMGINCASLVGPLLEGEIFGYERGAFTGAVHARPGLVEAASGGTVFLDELGELPLETQAKLLRMIDEKAVMRLGSRTLRPVDVRFISATNRDLEQAVNEGNFRSDLYYRLNGLSLSVPPLRERPDDFEPLTGALLQSLARQLDRVKVPRISPEAMELLRKHRWPGNVRELRNVLERCVVLCGDGVVTIEDLPQTILRPALAPPARAASVSEETSRAADKLRTQPLRVRDEVKAFERSRIVEALARCDGNQSEAAKLLGMSRRTLVARLSEFDLPRPRKSRSLG